MPTPSVGRNDPCPCGSGKKYKKCCLPHQSLVREPSATAQPQAPRAGVMYEEDIDRLSNSAVDAIQAKRHEEAEKLCEQLLREFPTLIDGHDRFAMLREAQGRCREAADHYTRALEIIGQRPDDYAPELVELFQHRRQEALSKSTPQA